MKLHPIAIIILLTLLYTIRLVALAQDACPAIVSSALTATHNACQDTERNQACYGNVLLTAEPQAGIDAFSFAQPGDKVDAGKIRTLTLSSLDETQKVWG